MVFCQIPAHHTPESRKFCINLRENLKSEGYVMEPRSENVSRCVFYLFIYLFTFACVVVLIPFELRGRSCVLDSSLDSVW